MSATAMPTLSDVRAFTGDYLIEAAWHWTDSAGRWTDAYDGLTRGIARPAGTVWSGEAAEAAARRVGGDRRRVNGAADELTAAASTARKAADDLHAAKTKLLSTVRAAEAAGFEVGEDFSLTTVETTTSATELAAREAQLRRFGTAIRSDVLALMTADQRAATQIAQAANGLRPLVFDGDEATRADTGFQAVDFHGVPLPEKPPNPPPLPPSEGWSTDPLMRAAQKIAYGHAYNKHRSDFPDLTQEQLAEVIYQTMQRSMTDPSGLTLGLSKVDRAPVIYDPEDRLIIIFDARPDASGGGTAFKPPDHDYVNRKTGSIVSIFAPEQLADGPTTSAQSGRIIGNGVVLPPSAAAVQVPDGGGGGGSWGDESVARGSLPDLNSLNDWGTHVPPEELAKSDGALGILGRIILGQTPPDPRDPKGWA
jgi:hypothetical protein